MTNSSSPQAPSGNPPLSPVVLHLPHDSTAIPIHVRGQFALSDAELAFELLRMTDSHTMRLFMGLSPASQMVTAQVSRLVVDVERFADDAQEVMAARGMGVVYTKTSFGGPLRRDLAANEHQALLSKFYHPHHDRLTRVVAEVLQQHGVALIVDAHSFPSIPLPCEIDRSGRRPAICIGTDGFHTPPELRAVFVRAFQREGFSTRVNSPFAGTLVPQAFYRKDPQVCSVMVEVRRDLYVDESTGNPLKDFDAIGGRIRTCCRRAANEFLTPILAKTHPFGNLPGPRAIATTTEHD